MTRTALFCALAGLSASATALSTQSNASRRAFLKAPLVASAVSAGWLLQHDDGCNCASCSFGVQPAGAYERRDVGGANRSPEQAAFNEQAYQTNNRLEKQGFKLDTAEEQKASLTAALADYSYSGTTSTKSDKKQKKSNKRES